MDPTSYLRLLYPRPHQVKELMPLTIGYNGGVLWTRGLSILQLIVLEGRWDTVVQCV